jgi:ankyrin repeat protein/L-ascorbate metabolism protein UlaG (beta-lactamase superfamily)
MLMNKTLAISVTVLLAAVLSAHGGEIHQAVADGDAARVRELLRGDPTLAEVPDEADQFSSLPLHLAARNGHMEIVKLLLDAGTDVDCGDSDESTPLHVAALRRHQDIVAFLLAKGADVNRRDKNGAYGLSFAASGGDSAIVGLILDSGADLNYRGPNGETLYHFACPRGLTELFDLLVERGDDINSATADGMTPLHWAAVRGNVDMVRRMLAAGAAPSPASPTGVTPLIIAAQRGHLEVGRLLLEAGAHPDSGGAGGYTALDGTARHQNLDFVRLLIEHGAGVNLQNERGETPLIQAVKGGDPDILEALLGAGADTEMTEANFGRTALHLASIRGYRDLAEHLVKAGTALDRRDNRGNTAVELAAVYGHGDVVDLLTASGAKPGRLVVSNGSLETQGELAEGEAVIWYLGHSGWGVKTRQHFLVFDYADRDRPPSQPGLCNGRIEPSELADETVTVLATHEHGDHLDSRIFGWKGQISDITYVLGCHTDSAPAYEYMEGRQTRNINGIDITTIESNDSGVGFLVSVDGVVIYHAGDHANRQRDFSGPYKAEIEFLAARGVRPDVAIMPISGCGFGDQEAVKMGVYYTLEALQPKVFLPMHAGGSEFRYHEFIAESKDKFPRIQMQAPVNRGDHFRYRDGRIS